MKKVTSLLLIILFAASCKNPKEDKSDTADVSNEPEKMDVMKLPDNYKLSLAQWALHVPIQKNLMDPMDFAEYASKHGFEGIEYVDQLYKLDSTLAYKDAVMKLALSWKEKNDEFNVKPVLIMIDRAGELVDPSEEKRKEAVEKHSNWVDAAAAIGAPTLRVNLFGITTEKEWHDESVASLKALCEYAATKNISIAVENHAQLSNHAAKLAAVIKEVNMPNCGTLPDFGNFCVMREGGERWGPAPCIEEYDPYQGIAELMPYAIGVSAKAHTFDAAGNETEIDYYRMMQIVKDDNFSGYIGVEYEDEVSEDPIAGINATRDLIIKAAAQAK
ncbi:MAG: sugar phosphate isomerase/epimerase family protein [Bacteroidota bacterium]